MHAHIYLKILEDWLKAICDCKFLITDSFHGACFALIFNKPFVCVRNKMRGNARFDSLEETFNIGCNFIDSINDLLEQDLNMDMDFSEINQIIVTEKERCLDKIEKILCQNYSNNKSAYKNSKINQMYLKRFTLEKLYKNIVLYFKYYRCRILANLTFGKKRAHYRNKKSILKQKLKEELKAW